MTTNEKDKIMTATFDELWIDLWGDLKPKFPSDENKLRNRYKLLQQTKLSEILANLNSMSDTVHWDEPEWGFPKGRSNHKECNIESALRELTEETGCKADDITLVTNVKPFEEVFMGSNYKSYKHKYYLAHMDYETSLRCCDMTFANYEVSKIAWKTAEECNLCFRAYNVEKIQLLERVNQTVNKIEEKRSSSITRA